MSLFLLALDRVPLRSENLYSAHVWLKYLRNDNTAISLKVILQKCDKHTRWSYTGVVKGMSKMDLAVLALDSDLETSCLSITKV